MSSSRAISRGFTAVNIRKFTLRASRLHDLVGLGTLTPPAARFLEAASGPASTSSSPVAPRRASPHFLKTPGFDVLSLLPSVSRGSRGELGS